MSTARPRAWPPRRGAIRLEEIAARACLERARRRPEEIDLLVNAGIYKENNTAEPALASMIQEDIGANPGHPPRRDRHGTFSFDVSNGGAGALTAAHVVDGFVGAGTARLGLVAAGDADPSARTSQGFPFRPAGAALLLGHTDGDEGFERFAFRTFPGLAHLFEAHVDWDPGRRRNVVRVHEEPGFAEACIEHAARTATDLLAAARLAAGDVDVLVTSQYPPGFPEQLARTMGVPADRLPAVAPELARAHTAGPLAALEAAVDSGAFARAGSVLFVAAAAGLTVAAALYRRGARRAP